MNKKGFTISELMAVIVILSILALMLTPAIIKIRKDYLEKTYESRVRLIKVAALDWASDNLVDIPSHVNSNYNNQVTCDTDTAFITIGELIEKEYLNGTDNNNTEMRNPVTNISLNDKKVCIRYDTNDIFTRKIIAYIEE